MTTMPCCHLPACLPLPAQFFSAIDILVALINASTNDSSANGSHAASFASVWTLFMVIAVSVAGTVILKKVGRCK